MRTALISALVILSIFGDHNSNGRSTRYSAASRNSKSFASIVRRRTFPVFIGSLSLSLVLHDVGFSALHQGPRFANTDCLQRNVGPQWSWACPTLLSFMPAVHNRPAGAHDIRAPEQRHVPNPFAEKILADLHRVLLLLVALSIFDTLVPSGFHSD